MRLRPRLPRLPLVLTVSGASITSAGFGWLLAPAAGLIAAGMLMLAAGVAVAVARGET